jgi:uncharacterized protein (TIGR03435 family)
MMNQFFKLVFTTLFLSSLCFFTRGAVPLIGENPPLLQATELLQAPADAKMNGEALKGKVVILEFWATWCGPCVASISHLNELAGKFKGQPVQFIAITAEDRTTIEKFLLKKPINAWIALDTNRAMNKAFAITGIPQTIVLDKEGKIAAITYPTALREEHISDLLAGKKINLADSGGSQVPAEKEKEAPPLFQVLIRPANNTNQQSCSQGGGEIRAMNYTIKQILPTVFDTFDDRITIKSPLPESHFDFIVIQPPHSDLAPNELMQAAAKSAFGLTATWETNQIDVLILTTRETNAPGLKPSPVKAMSWRSSTNSMEGIGVSAQAVAGFLETKLATPVVNQTGLTNDYGYDISLKWEQSMPGKPKLEAVKKAVQEQLGLDLVLERRPLEMLVVKRAEASKLATH